MPQQTQRTDSLADANVARDVTRAMGVVVFGVILTITLNWILPLVDWQTLTLRLPYLLPSINPIGTDFRSGVFEPAHGVLAGSDPYGDFRLVYPPATLLIGLASTLLPFRQAYLVDILLILFSCVAGLWITKRLAVESASGFVGLPRSTTGTVAQGVLLAAAMVTLLSYGLVFAIERGNFDAQAMLVAILGIWLLVKGKAGVLGPVMLLSLAMHMKVYPGILLLVVPWKYGWRTLPAIVAVNVALLLVTGWGNAAAFVAHMATYSASPFVWIGNHSSASFGSLLADYTSRLGLPAIPGWIFAGVPLLLWGTGAALLMPRRADARNLLFFVALSIPLMNLIPSTSHDYKLVILGVVMMILLVRLMEVTATRGFPRAMPALTVLLLLGIWIGRSYTLLPAILGNKYPAVLLLQALVLAVILDDVRAQSEHGLRLLPASDYPGVGRDDPIRFYTTPFLGSLYRKRVELCLSQLPGGLRVLEVGFGSGVTFPNLVEIYDEVWGVDPGVEVETIQQFWQTKGVTTQLRRGSVLEMPFPDSHFDAVLLVSILEHLPPTSQDQAFREVRRVLKPGGRAVYGVPVDRGLMRAMFRVLGYDIRRHHLSSEAQVRQAARGALEESRVIEMAGPFGFPRNIYQVGVFRR